MTAAIQADDLQRFVYWHGMKSTNRALCVAIDTEGIRFGLFSLLSSVRDMTSWGRANVWNNDDDVHWLRQQTTMSRFYQLRDGTPTPQHHQLSIGQLWMLWNWRYDCDWKALVGVADIMGRILSLKTKEVVGIT